MRGRGEAEGWAKEGECDVDGEVSTIEDSAGIGKGEKGKRRDGRTERGGRGEDSRASWAKGEYGACGVSAGQRTRHVEIIARPPSRKCGAKRDKGDESEVGGDQRWRDKAVGAAGRWANTRRVDGGSR